MALKVDEVINSYLKIRDELDKRRKAFQSFEKEANEQMTRLTMWLKTKGDEIGTDSFKSEAGTAYKVKKEFYRVGEWDDVLAWIRETDSYHVLEKRILKTAIREIVNETGQIPPGVRYEQEIDFQVRKPTKTR